MFKKCIQCDREIDKHYITITGRCIQQIRRTKKQNKQNKKEDVK
jgi:hypothetical protein